MPHNNKTLAKGTAYWVETAELNCGIKRDFNSVKQLELWKKLHLKNCSICCGGKNAHDFEIREVITQCYK